MGQVTFLKHLARNTAGNVMAISAAALVPLLAMVGGGIDASRTYMTYTRLQQACDSGALAGRKAMSNVTLLSQTERQKAEEFFDFNFPTNSDAATNKYSPKNISRVFAKGADGVVTGTASADLPTTIMNIFGYSSVPLSVTCQSTLNIPNTDVMFVLDVTGSMDDVPSGDTVKKIDGLKGAVKDFYAALGPGVASGPGRIRYGFMPYSSNVNVGKILYAANPAFLVGGQGSENYHYQSRVAQTTPENYITAYGSDSANVNGTATTTTSAWSGWSNVGYGVGSYPASVSGLSSSACSAKAAPPDEIPGYGTPNLSSEESVAYPDTTQTRNWTAKASGTWTQYRYSRSFSVCYLQKRTAQYDSTMPSTTNRSVTWATRNKFVQWNYQNATIDVSPVVQNSSAANPAYYSGYYDPSGANPNLNNGRVQNAYGYWNYYQTSTSPTISWAGCIEEADTVNDIVASSSLTPSSDAHDLDIDLVPSDSSTRWRPFLPQVQYDGNRYWLGRDAGWIANGFAACPRQANRLAMYASDYVALTKSSPSFNNYVDSLTAVGGTYHDIGLIWGARFLSPDGIFAADNRDSAAPGAYQVSRHIVFMTDGQLDTRSDANDPWGINNLDGRIAPTSANSARTNESHERRTQIICNSMKSKGFTIWVIGFGVSDLSQTLKDCASDDSHWSVASNATVLRSRFSAIAQTIGGLRLSQ